MFNCRHCGQPVAEDAELSQLLGAITDQQELGGRPLTFGGILAAAGFTLAEVSHRHCAAQLRTAHPELFNAEGKLLTPAQLAKRAKQQERQARTARGA